MGILNYLKELLSKPKIEAVCKHKDCLHIFNKMQQKEIVFKEKAELVDDIINRHSPIQVLGKIYSIGIGFTKCRLCNEGKTEHSYDWHFRRTKKGVWTKLGDSDVLYKGKLLKRIDGETDLVEWLKENNTKL